MPRVVTDPYAQVAGIIENAVMSEFSDIAYLQFHHDRLHESLGSDGKTHVAISPDDQITATADMVQNLFLQFYGPFSVEVVDPFQEVDPRPITNKAERMRQALYDVANVGTQQNWFFNVTDTDFPKDATGNKSRFEMRIRVWGNNTALFETTA